MKQFDFFSILKDSIKSFYKNPILMLPSLILLVFFVFFSQLSSNINYALQDLVSLTVWTILFSLISLIVISFFLSGLIGMSFKILEKKIKISDLFKYGWKFWLKNFIIILIIILTYNIIRYLAHDLSFFIGTFLNLDVKIAIFIFFFFYFAGLIGIIIFLTFSSFYLIINNCSIFKSIKKSFIIVKKNYIYTLIILLLFFVINNLLNLIQNKWIIEFANAVIIYPYFSLVLSRFLLEVDKEIRK